MSECDVVRESMPLLLTESLAPTARERAHQHIESCAACHEDWLAMRETWDLLAKLPEVEIPPHVRERFLGQVLPEAPDAKVIPFHRRRAVRWFAQAAAITLLVGGSYYAGNRTAPVRLASHPANLNGVEPMPVYSLAETRVLPAKAVNPNIEGRPDINNIQFVDADASDGKIGVAFDIKSHVTVTGSPTDKSMVRLLSYVLESDDRISPSRSRAIEWVRETYSDPQNADPEIARALGKVLRSEQHAGVRINAVETLKKLASAVAEPTRDALIEALRSDPNPAVRIKAVEALAKMASSGATFDPATVDTLRQKAAQENENLYVRVKAAEALSKIRP